jgi:hypothetical protein
MPEITASTAIDAVRHTGIGRFNVEVPMGMKPISQKYVVRTSVSVKELDGAGSQRGGYVSFWESQMERIVARGDPPGTASAILESKEFAANCRGVLFRGNSYNPSVLTWAALLDAGSHGVWFACDLSERHRQSALSSLLTVVHSYRVRDPRGVAFATHGFHLERGVLELIFAPYEEATVTFQDPSLELELQFSAETLRKGDATDESFLSRLQQAVEDGVAGDLRFEHGRTGRRTVGGLQGEEFIARTNESPMRLLYTWTHNGREMSASHPLVVIRMQSRTILHEQESQRIWDALLNSVRNLAL